MMRNSVKGKVVTVLVLAGVLGISGTSFAGTTKNMKNIIIDADSHRIMIEKQQVEHRHEPPMPPHYGRDVPPPPPHHMGHVLPPHHKPHHAGHVPPPHFKGRPPVPPHHGRDVPPPPPPHMVDRW